MNFFLFLMGLAGAGAAAGGMGGGSSEEEAPIVPRPVNTDPSRSPSAPVQQPPQAPPAPVTDAAAPPAPVTPQPPTDQNAGQPSPPQTPPAPETPPTPVADTPEPAPAQPAPDPAPEPPAPPVVGAPEPAPAPEPPVAEAPEPNPGPCPKTGDDVCLCDLDEDDDDDAQADPVGPCPKTGDDVCLCHLADDDAHDDHGGHDHGTPGPLPQTNAEIEAFVAAVKSSPETHMHDHGSAKMSEHMAAMDLVDRAEATHIAIGNGAWDDPSNWYKGLVPDDGAKALIPEGVHVTYEGMSDARLFTLRIDGHLDFATDANSQLILDTLVVSPSGRLTIGTEDNPISEDANVDIIFANNGAIDTDWDPTLLSRGMIAHGHVDIHGAVKDAHEKVIEDPMAGDMSILFDGTPEGWEVGDTIVIAGTQYEGYYNRFGDKGYAPPEDEERTITGIEDGRIYLDSALEFDHDTPRDDLKTSVANYSRNVSFETEDADTAEIHERGHIMFMHTDDVDVRYAEFHELGRTDKSEDTFNAGDLDNVDFDSNVRGRYSFHFHRSGTEDLDEPAIAIGNAIFGSPGWGVVHHDSNALIEGNATFNTFGAGYVAESGNETGVWHDNIAIQAQGMDWMGQKSTTDIETFDIARSGDGFWFSGRNVASTDNIAASVNTGFAYFHRNPFDENSALRFDSDASPIEGALHYNDLLRPDVHPILSFSGNETFAAKNGLFVLKSNPVQNHDVYSVLEDFTAWSVWQGVDLSYTGHYVLQDFDLVARDPGPNSKDWTIGVGIGGNSMDLTFVDTNLEGFKHGFDLEKKFTNPDFSPENHSYTVIDSTFTDVYEEYRHYDPSLDTILSSVDLPGLKPDIELDGPLTFNDTDTSIDPGGRTVEISGTKSDSLGETSFPNDVDNYSLSPDDVSDILSEKGYYTTSDGQNFFYLDLFFSDRLTGDIYVETHPVLLDDNVPLNNTGHHFYGGHTFNGIQDFGAPGDQTDDTADLWAVLTEGQVVLAEDLPSSPEAEEDANDLSPI